MAFYGLGPDTPASNRVTFDHNPSRATFKLAARPSRWLGLAGDYELLHASTSGVSTTTGLLNQTTAPGFGQRPQFNVFRGGAAP